MSCGLFHVLVCPVGCITCWYVLWVVSRYGCRLNNPGFGSRKGQEIYMFLETSTPALGPTQHRVKRVQASFIFGG